MHPVRTLARPLLASVFVSGGVDMLRNAGSLAPVAEPVTSKVVEAAQPAVDKAAEAAAPAVEAAAEKVVDLAESASEALPDAAQPVAGLADQAADAARPLAGETLLAGSDPTPPQVTIPDDPELLTKVNGGVMVGAGLLFAIGKLPRLSAAALAATLVPTTLAGHRFWEIDDEEERAAQQIHFMKNVALLGGLALAAIDTEGRPGVAWRARHAGRTARREAKLARRVASAEAGRRVAGARSAVAEVLPGSMS
ncbi:MAG TPA: DoxX family membrane protein [Iamia sp.]|nr:DoxX family membrane protein [Iamia sp.]